MLFNVIALFLLLLELHNYRHRDSQTMEFNILKTKQFRTLKLSSFFFLFSISTWNVHESNQTMKTANGSTEREK